MDDRQYKHDVRNAWQAVVLACYGIGVAVNDAQRLEYATIVMRECDELIRLLDPRVSPLASSDDSSGSVNSQARYP